MKVVILAGGKGSRLGADVPKPMVEIGGIPMLSHIMGIYKKYGYNEFIIATGYKKEYIEDYYKKDSCVTCIDTGLDALTGERVRECALRIGEDQFMLTYGDGVANINIDKLVRSYRKEVTVTAIHPPARFG
jgi:glucose-1-phosphate cytidylyltransferase